MLRAISQALLALGVGIPAVVGSAIAEQIAIPSLTMSDDQFLGGDPAPPEPVILSGLLQMPPGDGPHGAVILLHGSDGPQSALTWNWARLLNRAGLATLEIDSYTARGFEEIFTAQGRVGEFNNLIDTYRALDILAADPRIDPARVAVMGFSRGGIAALYSAMTRFETKYGSRSTKLAAHIPFYPPCNFRLSAELEVTPAPIRAFHGEADTWNPAAPCKAYVERLAEAGHDASITTYPGAHHAFDHVGSPSYNEKDDAQTSRRCFREEKEGRLHNAATGMPFSWTDACVEMGPAVQYNSAGAADAERRILEFLRELFDLPG